MIQSSEEMAVLISTICMISAPDPRTVIDSQRVGNSKRCGLPSRRFDTAVRPRLELTPESARICNDCRRRHNARQCYCSGDVAVFAAHQPAVAVEIELINALGCHGVVVRGNHTAAESYRLNAAIAHGGGKYATRFW